MMCDPTKYVTITHEVPECDGDKSRIDLVDSIVERLKPMRMPEFGVRYNHQSKSIEVTVLPEYQFFAAQLLKAKTTYLAEAQ